MNRIVGPEHAGAAGVNDRREPVLTCRLEDVERADQVDLGAEDRILTARRRQHAREMNDAVAASRGPLDLIRRADVPRAPVEVARNAVAGDFRDRRAIRIDVENRRRFRAARGAG